MIKLIAKLAEKYSKVSNTTCWWFGAFHQAKMPTSLIKKD